MNRILLASLIVALASLVQPAGAQSRFYARGEVPRPIDVARALAGPAFHPMVKKRGLSMNGTAPAMALQEPEAAPAQAGPGMAAAIAFDFDSAELAPASRGVLDAIAEGIKLIDRNAPLLIVGHTDAIGSDVYNTDLSRRRAEAVRRYLIDAHAIPAERLHTAGKGEAEPRDAAHPDAAENRRVEFAMG